MCLKKLLIIGPPLFFQYCHPAQNQPKSLIMFPFWDIFYKTQRAFQGVKLTRLISIFTSKLTKSDPKRTIRVKIHLLLEIQALLLFMYVIDFKDIRDHSFKTSACLRGKGCPHVPMVKRSQYIRIKNPLHKHFAGLPMVGVKNCENLPTSKMDGPLGDIES